jgi:hypothetical protein
VRASPETALVKHFQSNGEPHKARTNSALYYTKKNIVVSWKEWFVCSKVIGLSIRKQTYSRALARNLLITFEEKRLGYYYGGSSGNIQVIAYTLDNAFTNHRRAPRQ